MKKFGHYEVTAELGRGGMGVVYKAWEPSLNRQVAIKALGEHLLHDKDLVERFTREAKATAALNDPNVIQIYFIGSEQGQPFFAMEYIEGQSLDEILKNGSALTVKHAKNILKQACMGLAAAHKIDLVHRDIKPANLMITTDGTLKIVDFGIARTREYGDKLTNTGEFVGTPGYLSPEVCIGKEVDQRSDIFSLGIVFYEMLAGKVPFQNDSPLGLMLEVVQSEIPDIRGLNKKVDRKTSYILNKMIAKSPDERYQNCNNIISDLGNIVDNQTLATIKDNAKTVKLKVASANLSDQITLPSAAAVTENHLVPSKQPAGNKKWLAAAALFALVGASAFGYYNGYFPLPQNQKGEPLAILSDQDTLLAGGLQTDDLEPIQVESTFNGGVAATEQQDPGLVLATVDDDVAPTEDSTDQLEYSTLNEQIDLPPQGNLESIASNTSIPNGGIVEDANQPPAMANENSQTIATAVIPKPKKTKVHPLPLNKGVVVIAFGDPAVANPIEKIIESQLQQQGIKVMNEQFIAGMSQVLANGMDLAELKRLIQKNGGQAMVIANVNYVGTQELQYAGRYSELINAQLDIDTYDIKTGNSIGEGFGTKINYTSLNATDQASDAVMQFADRLTANLKNKI